MKIPELNEFVNWFEDNVLNHPKSNSNYESVSDSRFSKHDPRFDKNITSNEEDEDTSQGSEPTALTEEQEELKLFQYIIGIDDME